MLVVRLDCLLLLCSICSTDFVTAQANKTLSMGVMAALGGEYNYAMKEGCGFIIGLKEVEKRQILPGYKIKYTMADGQCNSKVGMKAAVDLWSKLDDLDVIIGSTCSVVCQPVALLTASLNIPQVSYTCTSDALSDTEQYPTFTRSTGGYKQYAYVLLEVAKTFNWTRVAILTETADLYSIVAKFTKSYFESQGLKVFYKTFTSMLNLDVVNIENREKLRQIIIELKSQVRVFIVLMYNKEVRHLMILAHELGMLNGNFHFYGVDNYPAFKKSYVFRPDLSDTFLSQGSMFTSVNIEVTNEYEKFEKDCIASFSLPVFDPYETYANVSLSPGAGLQHDAVLMWAYGVNKTLQQGHRPDDGLKVTQNIYNLTFQGITGTVVIDSQGDRIPNYLVRMVQNGTLVPILEWRAEDGEMTKLYKPDAPGDWSGLLWEGNGTTPPKDAPPCGWNNEFCEKEEPSPTALFAGIGVASGMLLLFVVVAGLGLRKHRYEVSVREAKWNVVTKSEIQPLGTGSVALQASRMTLQSTNTKDPNAASHFIEVVKVRNDIAALKKLGPQLADVTNRAVLVDLKLAKSAKIFPVGYAQQEVKDIDDLLLQHDNINPFLAVCLEVPDACILMQYANRGSLQDVLLRDDVKLTWDFKISLTNDIASGMDYLHDHEIGGHSRLTSSNCVVDSRWVCKITDYGLQDLQRLTKARETALTPSKLLWTAPEVLRLPSMDKIMTIKAADVYSFGIIVQEIILEDVPFGQNEPHIDDEETVQKVRTCDNPPYRPKVVKDDVTELWHKLMSGCWHEVPESRPTFNQVLKTIEEINGGKRLQLVDNMIRRLEDYTKNLEDIVAERTRELFEEKDKVELLLTELLPKSVMESLKKAERIAPETFDNVTIFFSDIVSFTQISAAGTPIDVVRMLNLMYTLFDDIAAKYDVYKVATIGDAYFVASGVPIRNGDQHAAEISKMALGLLKAVANLPIPHLPNEKLKLRIGIHSGSCVAGIAGVKMPRYLLFGDTVDIASRMESGGESMRIHISCTTKELLTSEFKIVERGESEVKGLGKTITYWLEV